MENNKFNCIDANRINLVDFLSNLGYTPQKVRNNDYWYLSPLRNEKTPSFKVNRKLNVWFDFGEGIGGSLVDFGVQYFKCSVSELLTRLGQNNMYNFSFHPHFADEKKDASNGKIQIVNEQHLTAKHLVDYLHQRCIPLSIAEQFCREIEFILYGKKQLAIGFKNDAGGYELRSHYFKGGNSPKTITTVNNNATQIFVVEGFFDFLSLKVLLSKKDNSPLKDLTKIQTDFVILNSLSFFEKIHQQMKKYVAVNLFLDRDSSGIKATRKAILSDSIYKDQSILYKGFKDLNDKLIGKELVIKQEKGVRQHF
jgi:DNA primase